MILLCKGTSAPLLKCQGINAPAIPPFSGVLIQTLNFKS